MNLKKLIPIFLLSTILTSTSIHYHYHFTNSHKTQKKRKPNAIKTKLKTNHLQTINLKNRNHLQENVPSLTTIGITLIKLDSKDDKKGYALKDTNWDGLLLLSHVGGKISVISFFRGSMDTWHLEESSEGVYVRGDGEEKDYYLSHANGALGLKKGKGDSEKWSK